MTINQDELIAGISNKSLLIFSTMLLGFAWLLFDAGLLLIWIEDEEYGHGLMVIAVLAYVLYRNKESLMTGQAAPSWFGMLAVTAALVVFLLGELSGIAPIRMYSIWMFALAATFSIGGWPLFRKLLVPLLIIFLLIPLPNVLGPMLTSQLQLISSKLGVWVIRSLGGVVFLEGNVIDMGGTKLLVAEACAGLRYLFPLMSIGAIAGYLMRAPVWMRWAVFLSTIPVTIFMNSFRIGVTGLLVDAYGMSHTEGFLHFFEGWVVFVASLVILVLFAWLLVKMLPGQSSFATVFSFEHLFANQNEQSNSTWHAKMPVVVFMASLLIAAIAITPLAKRDSAPVASKPMSSFPLTLGNWRANQTRLPVSVETASGASDYYYGNFLSADNKRVNLYIAYYEDQKIGAAPHSPTLCIPGDGWVIRSDTLVPLTSKSGKTIQVSRLMMTKGDDTSIAYYWVKQGDRVFNKQFMARLDLIRFAITQNRADAALVRLVSFVRGGESIEDADAKIRELAAEFLEVLPDYVPD